MIETEERAKVDTPLLFACLAVGVVLGGLLVGYEPVGGDPDRMYRPLKTELAKALREGRLPFWSHAFGLGVPLVAESHVAAFYPPNLVLYALLDVPTAYRLSMWIHGVALAAMTTIYARSLGLSPWGSALAAVSFSLCGFQAIHATHEPFYTLMPYLPMALWLSSRYVATGRATWLAWLALALGVQWTIGHFQIQMWTGGLVLIAGWWRVAADRRPWSRAIGLGVAVGWGMAVAAVQLALSWDFARSAGQTARPLRDMAFFSYPPAHWIEPALPWFFRGLKYGGEDPYWFGQGTTGYEAMFSFGTLPLALAFVGLIDGGRGRPSTWFWRLAVVISLALATMPRWWLEGYATLLQLPGLGYFRAPARYTVIASLGLALLAGQGLDRLVSSRRWRVGLILAIIFAVSACGFGLWWSGRPDFRSASGPVGLPFGLATGVATWGLTIAVLVAWRSGKVGGWLPLLVALCELGVLYHMGPSEWGWAVELPARSPVLSAIVSDAGGGRVGGTVDNLPLRAGRATATPYLGVALTPINRRLHDLQERAIPHGPEANLWQRRLGVTQSVWDHPVSFGPESSETVYDDPALDLLAYRPVGVPSRRRWRVVRHGPPYPEARAILTARIAPDLRAMIEALSRRDDPSETWFLPGDAPPIDGPRASHARVMNYDGRTAFVEHDGPCDLVFTRANDSGWVARIDDGPPRPMMQADGGLQAIHLTGSGTSRVSVRYAPRGLWPGAATSIAATLAALVVISSTIANRRAQIVQGLR